MDLVNEYSLITCFIIVIYSVKLRSIFELFNSNCHNSDAPQTVSAISLLKQNSAVSHRAAEAGFPACLKLEVKILPQLIMAGYQSLVRITKIFYVIQSGDRGIRFSNHGSV